MKILISFFDPDNDFRTNNWRQVDIDGVHAEFYQKQIKTYDYHFLLSDDIPSRPDEQNETEIKFWTQFRALRSYLEFDIKERELPVQLRFSYLDMIQRDSDDSRQEELLSLIKDIKEEFPEALIQAYITPGTEVTRSIWHTLKEKMGIDLFHIPLKNERGNRSLTEAYEYKELGSTHSVSSIKPEKTNTELIKNDAINRIYKRAENIGRNSSKIAIILGETGTGKEEIAKHIFDHSFRKKHKGEDSFFAVNCAAFTEELLRSELFGHVKGAFTGAKNNKKGFFEMAHEGVLFLDEIGDTSLYIQSALLRVLQNGEFQKVGSTKTERFDVQIICATNANILEKIKAGTFRSDLYYRFADPEIWTLAFRDFSDSEKKEMFDFFLRKASQKEVHTIQGIHDHPRKYLDDQVLATLLQYDFPGNFRELKILCESFYTTVEGKYIQKEDLPLRIRQGKSTEEEEYSIEYAKALAVRKAYEKVGRIKKAAMHLTEIKHQATFDRLLKLTEPKNNDNETTT